MAKTQKETLTVKGWQTTFVWQPKQGTPLVRFDYCQRGIRPAAEAQSALGRLRVRGCGYLLATGRCLYIEYLNWVPLGRGQYLSIYSENFRSWYLNVGLS